jgi:hypothetical protein
MSGGGGTISTSEPRLGALRVQQSSYGLAMPIVYGRTRISGNLVWYGDFTAIAHTTTTTSGGKGGGGGVSQQNTTYTYEAAVLLALCEGPVGGIVSVWQGKSRFDGIAQLALTLASGTPGQPTWGHLSSQHPTQALGYSSTALLYSANFALTANAEVDNHTFEVDAKLQFGGGVVDAEPSAIVQDLLTNAQYGAAFPAGSLGDLSSYANYCRAMGLFISPALTQQQEAREHIKTITDMTNSACVWSEGQLKIIPYGDEAITGNGATYTPNLTPIYDLTDDDFIVGGDGEDPVKCRRRTPADAFNQVQVEYLNRANGYNLEIVEAKDQANIERFGLRPRDPIKMHGICEAAVARRAAQLQLQRSLYVRNEYEFRLGWRYVLLEPMDLVTLTDAGLGLDRTPVRITSVEEDADGVLSFLAEDYPFGIASATLYPAQSGAGFAADYNAVPGNVAAPVFFEPPIEMATATGLEVWCAVSGQAGSVGGLWGGCNVWASLDGDNYKQVGTVRGGARYGTTTAALAANGTSVPVALVGRGGQMLSGTAQDAQFLNTLCWVGTPAGGEFVAHTTATLTAPGAYTLGGLVRGAYTTPVVAHAAGQQFVRVDDAICKGDPLDVAMIGQPVYFKFCSFNAYGGGTQTLAEVQAYAYTPTGSMLKLPPSNVVDLSITIESNGVRVRWSACPDADYASTRIKVGASWTDAEAVADKNATSHLLGWVQAGTMRVWAVHVDHFGNESITPVTTSTIVRAPAQVQMLATEMQANALTMQWADAKTDQPILRYEYFVGNPGASLADCISWGSAGSDGRSDLRFFRTPGLKQVYVVAYDLALNASTPAGFQVTSIMPPDFVLATEYHEDWQLFETSNLTIINGSNGQLLVPVAEQTWGTHFASRSWANAQAQIDAGYPVWWQPAQTSGYHIELHDCGRVIQGGVINVSTTTQLWGTGATEQVSIRVSADSITWGQWIDSTSYQASTFRYVEVRYAVTSNGHGAFLVDDIYVDVRVSSLTETTVLAISGSDTVGTFYATTKDFVDIQTVQVTALSSPAIAKTNAVIKDDAAPFGVYVQAWDSSIPPQRVSGAVSITITGV